MKNIETIVITLLTVFLSVIIFLLSIKGDAGVPIAYQGADRSTVVGGPFESSGSTSRFALTESLAENGTVFFSEDLAKFSSPDLVYHNGKYSTIFTPGVSFLGLPFYKLGGIFGMPQVGAYATVTLFALVNILLIAAVAKKLGAGMAAGLLAGVTFAFASNAFSYATTYTQHVMSSAVLLGALLIAAAKPNLFFSILLGVLAGLGLLLDIPNAFMLLPIAILFIAKHIKIEKKQLKSYLTLKAGFLFVIVGLVPLLFLYGWYNHEISGSYSTLAQFIGRVDYEDSKLPKLPEKVDAYAEKLPFSTRILLPGFYTLLLSDERSWLFYSPVLLLGLIGGYLAYKKKETNILATTILGVLTINILLYAMFGDPWGGWAFGPRYLIPGAAMLSVLLAVALQRFARNIFFIVGFIGLFLYSALINTVGVLTTTQVPPRHEVIGDSLQIPWTFAYNFQLFDANRLGSLVYNLFFSSILSSQVYGGIVIGLVVLLAGFLYMMVIFDEGRRK
ncbi:MAG: hypothetical protein RLZZ455_142 [Candidatus Parcubacteria bacterium]|jgi:4-amino-4-deoxy-L-arabinose transferase-like glycosyltransferase